MTSATSSSQKGRHLGHRTRYALAGLRHAFLTERSIRTECLAAVAAIGVTGWLRPGWLWAGLVAVAIALVFVAELLNTALEQALDGLHPHQAPFVAVAKDCAAAAVFVASTLSVVLFVFMLAATLT